MQVVLQVSNGKANVKQLTLQSDTVIGRSPECSLKVASNQVSRRHCQISIREPQVFIRDLGSANGTFVDGLQIPQDQDKELVPGNVVWVGPLKFVVQFTPACRVAVPCAAPPPSTIVATAEAFPPTATPVTTVRMGETLADTAAVCVAAPAPTVAAPPEIEPALAPGDEGALPDFSFLQPGSGELPAAESPLPTATGKAAELAATAEPAEEMGFDFGAPLASPPAAPREAEAAPPKRRSFFDFLGLSKKKAAATAAAVEPTGGADAACSIPAADEEQTLIMEPGTGPAMEADPSVEAPCFAFPAEPEPSTPTEAVIAPPAPPADDEEDALKNFFGKFQ
jgi:predicted component of type VI protein secretion system